MASTLVQLRTRFYTRMDEGASAYVTTSTANDALNEAYMLLVGIYTRKTPMYFLGSTLIYALAGQRVYALVPEFRRLVKAYYIGNTSPIDATKAVHVPLMRFTQQELRVGAVGSVQYSALTNSPIPKYDIQNKVLVIDPCPLANNEWVVELIYQVTPSMLVNDTDSISDVILPGHDQWIVNQAVIMMRAGKEEQQVADLLQINSGIRQEIEDDLAEQDIGEKKRVIDNAPYGAGWV